MEVQQERRAYEDRRAFAVYYRYGHERRDNTTNRRLQSVEDELSYASASTAHGDTGTFDRNAEIFKTIGEAFGVQPESLEMVEHDEILDNSEYCPSYGDLESRCAELEAKLAESQKCSERYRIQVRDILLAFNSSRH